MTLFALLFESWLWFPLLSAFKWFCALRRIHITCSTEFGNWLLTTDWQQLGAFPSWPIRRDDDAPSWSFKHRWRLMLPTFPQDPQTMSECRDLEFYWLVILFTGHRINFFCFASLLFSSTEHTPREVAPARLSLWELTPQTLKLPSDFKDHKSFSTVCVDLGSVLQFQSMFPLKAPSSQSKRTFTIRIPHKGNNHIWDEQVVIRAQGDSIRDTLSVKSLHWNHPYC